MARSDGAVYIETLVDTQGFGRGMNTIERRLNNLSGAVKRLGGVIASVFAIQQLVAFGKEAIKLGSDLEEVQNVVDVTFTSMSKQVDEFAKNAQKSAGLSETMAKRYVGTFGAMAKAFGFVEHDAFNMSTTLAQLAGDVASFYNITQDEAYTKLKSVFSGETETLKDLGIVMTQSALDAYAMAKGFNKTTRQMTEQEKVALRYQFILDQLSTAQGDFARTSDSWANQVRILSLNFDTFKANVGKALINIFTPFLKMLNVIVEKMAQLSSYFVAFSEMLVGKSTSSGGGSPNNALSSIAGGYDDVAESAKKAEKAQAKYLSGLDEIRTFTTQKTDSEGGVGAGSFDFGSVLAGNNTLNETNEKVNSILERAKELSDVFKKGFTDGLGDSSARLEIIKNSIQSIKNSLSDNFDDEVKNSFNDLIEQFAYSFGQIAGSVSSIGLSLGANLTGGLAQYLQSDKERIKQYILDMFDISGDIASQIGNFADAFADVFEVISSEAGIQITSDIFGIFGEIFMGIGELAGRLVLDVTKLITQPFINSKEEIKKSMQDLLDGFSSFTGFLKKLISDAVVFAKNIYDEVIAPIFENAIARITEFTQQHLTPLISQIGKFFNEVGNALLIFWNEVLQPVINWIINNILPVIVPIINTLVNAIEISFGFIADLFSGFLQILTGVVEFITGVFTGNWEKAWEGVKDIFKGIINSISATIEYFVNHAINLINGLIGGINKLTGIAGIPSIPLIPELNIPKLATGAVIPPNAPFLAMLGDQKSGNNIEAPEELIRKIVREETGNNNVGGNVTLPIYVDGMKLFEIMVSKAKLMQASTGTNLLVEL